jgi:GNAT superfamily N-acetyltransferase
MNFHIRKLEVAEIAGIGRIDNSDVVDARYVCRRQPHGLGLTLQRQEVRPPEQEPTWGQEELRGRFTLWKRNCQEGAVFFGAFLRGALVGVSLVTKLADGATGELYSLHVDRQHRRQGVGTALLDAAEAQGKAWCCRRLLVYTGLKASSLDFYRSRGYQVVGIQDPRVKTKNFDLTLVKEFQ